MTDAIVRAVVRELEPRFAAIEKRLDQCATKADLAGFATRADLAGFATRADLAGFATKADVGRFATKRQMVGWMFALWLVQSATTFALLRFAIN